MEIKDRIRMIMEREKVPPRVFAETIGVQQSTLSHILNDRNKPSLEVVMKVHQTYSYVNLEWLLYGKGEMITSAEVLLRFLPMEIISLLCLMRIL